MTTQTPLASKATQLLVVPFLVACAIVASAFGAISQSAAVQAAPITVAMTAPATTGGFIDHSVVLNAPDGLPAPNQASLSVAAYDD
jgi:hypothetical protein